MMSCCCCQGWSGKREICWECAAILWPHRKVNTGAKVLHGKLLVVPDVPVVPLLT
jgi:hypothetical protein